MSNLTGHRSDAAPPTAPLTPAAIAALLQQKKDELAKRANVRPDDIQEKLAKARRLQQQIQQQQQQLQHSADAGRPSSADAGRQEGRGGLQTAVHPSLQKDVNGNLIVRPIDPTNLVPRFEFSTTKVTLLLDMGKEKNDTHGDARRTSGWRPNNSSNSNSNSNKTRRRKRTST